MIFLKPNKDAIPVTTLLHMRRTVWELGDIRVCVAYLAKGRIATPGSPFRTSDMQETKC